MFKPKFTPCGEDPQGRRNPLRRATPLARYAHLSDMCATRPAGPGNDQAAQACFVISYLDYNVIQITVPGVFFPKPRRLFTGTVPLWARRRLAIAFGATSVVPEGEACRDGTDARGEPDLRRCAAGWSAGMCTRAGSHCLASLPACTRRTPANRACRLCMLHLVIRPSCAVTPKRSKWRWRAVGRARLRRIAVGGAIRKPVPERPTLAHSSSCGQLGIFAAH